MVKKKKNNPKKMLKDSEAEYLNKKDKQNENYYK